MGRLTIRGMVRFSPSHICVECVRVADVRMCWLVVAWIAGTGKQGDKQSYDVWVAFEFTPVLASFIQTNAASLEVGTYQLINEAYSDDYVIVKDGDSTDGAPVVTKNKATEAEKVSMSYVRLHVGLADLGY